MASRKRPIIALVFMVAASAVALANPQPKQAGAAAAGWSTPVNVSHSDRYDNSPDITATADGAALIVWGGAEDTGCDGHGYVIAASNNPLTGNFTGGALDEACVAANGNIRVQHDGLNRKHIVYWQADRGGTICDYYARIEADGTVSVRHEQIPGTCGLSRKNTALTVSPGGTVHAFFGNNNKGEIYYYRRSPEGQWVIQGERVVSTGAGDITTAVTANGVLMTAWKGPAPGGNTDIFAATRNPDGTWSPEDVSRECCQPDCPLTSKAIRPTLAADPSGGVRMAWSDERCDPRSPEPVHHEIYYREWVPGSGWTGKPLVRAARIGGTSYQSAIAVDPAGTAHIVLVNANGPTTAVFYVSGRGTTFGDPVAPFMSWAGKNYTYSKDVALDYNGGYLHLTVDSNQDDPAKEVYYSYMKVGPAPPAPTPGPPAPPPPPPTLTPAVVINFSPPPVPVPGDQSRVFPETGKTISGMFLQYWNEHGGLPQQGYPISSMMGEVSALNKKPYSVQYFERAVFEYHPENWPPYDVLLSQLGTFQYRKKYPNGAPGQVPDRNNSQLFKETGHWIGGGFYQYWQSHGGLAQQGYPISDEFQEKSDVDGKTYIVQYFERSVIEWHPGNQDPYKVLLSLLGVFQYKQKYVAR